MTNVLTIGIFNVRIVEQGEKYGNGAVNRYNEQLVEFTDNRYMKCGVGFGQPISSYMLSTIQDRDYGYGLNLEGSVPEWSVSVAQMSQVYSWIAEELLQSVEF